jgi:hypothetical protein
VRWLRVVVMVDVVVMRFVMDAMVMMTRMVLVATWIPRTASLCRRKRGSENDHSQSNFQVHDVFIPLLLVGARRASTAKPRHASGSGKC